MQCFNIRFANVALMTAASQEGARRRDWLLKVPFVSCIKETGGFL